MTGQPASPGDLPVLTDTHCHLDFSAFDEDRQAILERARHLGVARILNPGIDLDSSRAAVRLAAIYTEVYAAVGVHPNEAFTWQDGTLGALRELACEGASSKIVAIGEIGLDYYRDRAPRELQRQAFIAQLGLAAELDLPVVIHSRQSEEDLIAILADWQAELASRDSPLARRPGVLHSFSGDIHVMQAAVGLNFLIGITGPVTFSKATELHQVVAHIPDYHLLIETDAPFLTPHPFRGRRNEPGFVRLVAEKIAALHGISFSAVAQITTANAGRLFQWYL